MKELGIDEIRPVQLAILARIAEFCDLHEINYFLFAGTLIGAVRHKGYIPWDDDIDICMLRSDYDRFFAEFNGAYPNLFALNPETDKACYSATGKVINTDTLLIEELDNVQPIGIYVDVFPLDNLPDTEEEIIRLDKKLRPLRKIKILKLLRVNKARAWYKNALIIAGTALTCSIPLKAVVRRIDKLSRTYSDMPGAVNVGDIAEFTYGMREVLKKEWFSEKCTLVFEGAGYACPASYHAVLSKLYGDYMRLPPKEKQVSHHLFTAYMKTTDK